MRFRPSIFVISNRSIFHTTYYTLCRVLSYTPNIPNQTLFPAIGLMVSFCSITLSVKQLICFCCSSTSSVRFLSCFVNCTHLIVRFFTISFSKKGSSENDTIQVPVSQGQRTGRTGKTNKSLVKRQTPMKMVPSFIGVLFYDTVLAPLFIFSLLQSFKKGFPISRKAP